MVNISFFSRAGSPAPLQERLFVTSFSFDCDFRSKGALHPGKECSPYKEKAKAKGNGFSQFSCVVLVLLESHIHYGRTRGQRAFVACSRRA